MAWLNGSHSTQYLQYLLALPCPVHPTCPTERNCDGPVPRGAAADLLRAVAQAERFEVIREAEEWDQQVTRWYHQQASNQAGTNVAFRYQVVIQKSAGKSRVCHLVIEKITGKSRITPKRVHLLLRELDCRFQT